jgi:geranylgeranyl pyrophosphate synthase
VLIHSNSQGEILSTAAKHLCMAPGARRLRPRLVLGVGQLLGVAEEHLIDLAACVEAIHGASLLHDDVVDEGTLRRGIPTANARFGNDVAVLAGDFTLVRAFGALRRYPAVLTDGAIVLVEEMTRAAILEIECRGRAELSVAQWRAIADGKCGSLFGYCCAGAAIVAGRPELAEVLDAFGRKMGIAFQMADDLRDLVDDSLGKDRYADLKNRNPSFLLASLPDALEQELRTLWSSVFVTPHAASAFGAKLARAGVVREAVSVLDKELLGVVELWTSAGLPEQVAEEICRAIRAQLGKREDA